MADKKLLRWGLLGCGGIARRMAGVIASRENMELAAVAAQDGARAEAFARECGAARHYARYADLLADDGVDAVYVANIHPVHYESVRACLLAGKPVLCEKPLTMTAAEAEALFRLAEEKNILLMEAMWTRYLPACREAVALAHSGALGELKGAMVDFTTHFPYDPHHRVYDPAKGGSALLDVGVYTIHMAFSALGADYRAAGVSGRLAPTGVDSFAALTLEYPQGRTAVLTCGCDRVGTSEASLCGQNARISLPQFFGATEFTVHTPGQPDETRRFEKIDGFAYELEEFRQLWSEGRIESLVVPHRETVAAMKLMEWAMDGIRHGGARAERTAIEAFR